jgi:hypothetical protein
VHGLIKCIKYYSGDPINEKEMGGTCGKYGGENGYWVGDLGADGWIILKGILKNRVGGRGLD